MGFNTPIVILNDHLHIIERDEQFGKKLANAIIGASRDRLSFGGFSILPSHHADYERILVVGRNTIRELRPDDLEMLRYQFEAMGHTIRKKRQPKPTRETTNG